MAIIPIDLYPKTLNKEGVKEVLRTAYDRFCDASNTVVIYIQGEKGDALPSSIWAENIKVLPLVHLLSESFVYTFATIVPWLIKRVDNKKLEKCSCVFVIIEQFKEKVVFYLGNV